MIDHWRLVVFYQFGKECIILLDSLIYYAWDRKVHFGLPKVLRCAFSSIRKLCWQLWTHQTTARLSCLLTQENQPGSYNLNFLLHSHRCRSRRSQLGTHLLFGPGCLNQYLLRCFFFINKFRHLNEVNKLVLLISNQIKILIQVVSTFKSWFRV